MQTKETKRYAGDIDGRMEFVYALMWAKQHGVVEKTKPSAYCGLAGARILLTQDLHVFKAVLGPPKDWWEPRDQRIANLIIPAGETVVICKIGDYHKCRATKAVVHSIVNKNTHTRCSKAFSGHDMSFEYRVGRAVKPDRGFAFNIEACASGIHFYMDVQSAHCHHA